ncbi:hypothetical protein KSP39_PZI009110 [Platanthera zijinensis]|uniref:J domain-containing protein n=1 Tax=Platanthera zijinensis TaxID=2320716 RepID=A0AAP0G7D8_9ASPA
MAGGDGRGLSTSEDHVDHYVVLGLPSGEEGSKLSLKEIEKAYRNQSRHRHPDKRPDDPNATADFQLLTSSFEVLRDETTRSSFDAKLRSRREKVFRDSFQDTKRRKMATDLEDRERAAAAVDPSEEVQRKERMKAQELKNEIADFKARRAKKASEQISGKQKREEKLGASLDKGRMLKVSWDRSAGDYEVAKLRENFERFGSVEDVVIRSKTSKNRASAIIVMTSREAMIRAAQSMGGHIANPLLVLPLEPIVPNFSSNSSVNQGESEFSNVVGAGFEAYEAFVMKKLQEVNVCSLH